MAERDALWLLEQHLEELRRRHKDTQEWWRALDTKAQGNIVACGVLLAGTLAKMDLYENCNHWLQLALFAFSVCALLVALCVSVRALLITRTIAPQPVEDLERQVAHLEDKLWKVSSDGRGPNESIRKFLRNQSRLLRECIVSDVSAAKSKAQQIYLGQLVLISSVVSITALAVIRVGAVPC